jgi:hypothetical protein
MDFGNSRLDAAERDQLIATQHECFIGFNNDEGWPVAVVQTYVWAHGALWVTAFADRPRVSRLAADSRCVVAVSNSGAPPGAERMMSARSLATIHTDDETKTWFYPMFAMRASGDEAAAAQFARILARQDRVIIELRPEAFTTFDAARLRSGGRPPGKVEQ